MMSPRLPYPRTTRPRTLRGIGACALAAACAASIAVATAATPALAADASEQRAASRDWNPYFEDLRPVPVVDARRVVVLFDDPSLGEWVAAGDRPMTAAQRTA